MGLDRFVLGGLSMGGYAALAYWRLFGAEGRLAGMVLADTRAEADTPDGKLARDATVRLVREEGLSALADQLLPRLLSPGAAPAVVAHVRALIESQHPEGVIAASLAMRDRPPSEELLQAIDVPVLVVCGDADTMTPPEVHRRIAGRVRQGRYVELAGAGHLSSLEQPEAFSSALGSFLRDVGA